MNNQKLQAAMKYGGIIGGAAVISTILFYLKGNLLESQFSFINIIIITSGLGIFMRRYRDKFLGGNITFGKAFQFGFLISLFFSALLSLLYYTLYRSDNSLIQTFLLQAEQNMSIWSLSDKDVDTMLNLLPRIYTPFVIAFFQFIGNLIYGIIISLITAAFTKRNNDPFKDSMNKIKD